jgi:hypothetical protein
MPVTQAHPGQVYWVSNATTSVLPGQIGGSDGNPGTFNAPFSTIEFAVARCIAGRGDIIFVKPGHAETIADATTLTLDVAGVAIIGLGVGSARPTLTFTTIATANIPVTAANVSVKNILFKANVAAVASVFTATGTSTPTDFTVDSCEFRDGSSILNFVSVVTGNATANSLDGLSFTNNVISNLGTTAASTSIKTASVTDRMTVADNIGVYAVLNDTAAMLATGSSNVTNFAFCRNNITRPNTSTTSGLAISTSGTAWTGQCTDNRIFGLNNTAQIWINTGTKLGFNQNFCPITAAADKSGLINPAAV